MYLNSDKGEVLGGFMEHAKWRGKKPNTKQPPKLFQSSRTVEPVFRYNLIGELLKNKGKFLGFFLCLPRHN